MRGKQYLKEPEQYAAVYNKGASWVDRNIVMKSLPNGLGYTRYGFSVSSRVGGAVVRNRVKRRLREIFHAASIEPGWDIVVIARPVTAAADFSVLSNAVSQLLIKAKLIKPEVSPPLTK